MSLSKSKLDRASRPESETMTFTHDGIFLLDIKLGNDRSIHISRPWSGGKEVAVTGAPDENTTMISHFQTRTLDDTWKVRGKVLRKAHGVLSPDGRTLTMTVDGQNAQGQAEHRVEVFQKR